MRLPVQEGGARVREGAREPWREEGQNMGPEVKGVECQWSKGIKGMGQRRDC